MKNYAKKRLLIIPAKGQSTRIPNKNIKNFFGKPIIHYSIKAAKKSKLFEMIHVSTNSKKIFDIAKKMKVMPIFFRDEYLCKQNTGIFDVIKKDYLKLTKLGYNFHEIWCLFPCAPLINYLDLKRLSKNIDLKKTKLPCISVSKFPAPIQWAYEMKKNDKIFPLFKNKHLIQSQKLKETYFDVGLLSVFNNKDLINNNKKKINKNLYGYKLPWGKVVDIDNMDDWKIAEKLYRLKND